MAAIARSKCSFEKKMSRPSGCRPNSARVQHCHESTKTRHRRAIAGREPEPTDACVVDVWRCDNFVIFIIFFWEDVVE